MTQQTISVREKHLTLFALLLVFLLGALDSTIVGTAMPRIIQHRNWVGVWIVAASLLFALFIPSIPDHGELKDCRN